jgi:hypothetical protein
MGESNDERIARKKRERAEFLKQEKEDAELAARLDSDPEFAEQFDDSFERLVVKTDDEFMRKFAKEKGYSKSETEAMIRAAEKARKAMTGGWFGSQDPKKAAEIIDGNKGLRAMKKDKEEKSCFLALLVLASGGLLTFAAMIYGAAQAIASVWP